MTIKYYESVDFIFAAKHFADRNKPADPDYPGMAEISEWCSETEKKLSPFLLNDISLIIEKMYLPTVFLFYLAVKDGDSAETGSELLDRLDAMSAAQFMENFKKMLPGDARNILTAEKILPAIADNSLNSGHDFAVEAGLLEGFFKDVEDFKKRLHRTYSDFYSEAFLPAKEKYSSLVKDKFEIHRLLLLENGDDYFHRLGLPRLIKQDKPFKFLKIYFSFFADNEISSFGNVSTIIVGGATDQRVRFHSARSMTDIFFSCLGDPKRLEILRLTAQRPWYNTELAEHFDVKPATLSYHMNKLVTANLITIVKGENRRLYYSINRDAINEYLGFTSQDLLGFDS